MEKPGRVLGKDPGKLVHPLRRHTSASADLQRRCGCDNRCQEEPRQSRRPMFRARQLHNG